MYYSQGGVKRENHHIGEFLLGVLKNMEKFVLDTERYRLRRLKPGDFPQVAALIYEAIGDLAEFFTGADSSEMAIVRLQALVAARGTRFSHEFALGIEAILDGKLVALGSAYPEAQMDALTAKTLSVSEAMGWQIEPAIRQRLLAEREAPKGTYYIDHLAVAPAHRGNALGTVLLMALIAEGKTMGHKVVSLLADVENPAAQRLYERLGFSPEGLVRANGHDYNALIYKSL